MSHLLAFASRPRRQVRAYVGGQPITDSYGKVQLKRLTKMILEEPKKIKRDLGTKGNFTMYEVHTIVQEIFLIYDIKAKKVVAFAMLDSLKYRPKYKTLTTLYVVKAYRGLKLATILHLGALHVHKKLMSDTTMALGALNAFRSLEQHGYKVKMFDTEERVTVPFEWGTDGIPTVDGGSIEESDRYALYV